VVDGATQIKIKIKSRSTADQQQINSQINSQIKSNPPRVAPYIPSRSPRYIRGTLTAG
jgi:hypothetical protein